jgi:hypothetical protein
MAQPIFEGLIFDENDQLVEAGFVGDEPCYIVDDAGFKRHISSEYVDRQIWEFMTAQIKGKEDMLADETAKMLGQDDLFSHALIESQLKNVDQQFESLQKTGIPAEGRTYLGMMGFKVVINVHGEVIRVDQPAASPQEGE